MRIGRLGFAETVGIAVGRVHDDVRVRESRFSGAIRSKRVG